MSNVRTLLSPVQQGDDWRVQIVWPNGIVHHVGKFSSLRDAGNWITAHSHLTTSAAAKGETPPEPAQQEPV